MKFNKTRNRGVVVGKFESLGTTVFSFLVHYCWGGWEWSNCMIKARLMFTELYLLYYFNK